MYQLVARLVRRLLTDDIEIQNAGQTVTGNKLMQTWTQGSELFTISVPTFYFLMLHLWPFGMFPLSPWQLGLSLPPAFASLLGPLYFSLEEELHQGVV